MLGFPEIEDAAAFREWRAQPARWLPIVLDIAAAHGLKRSDPHVFATGSNLVIALDAGTFLKIFPPIFRAQFLSEQTALTQLQGWVEVPIPRILLVGERDGWPYIAMTRLTGVVGSEVYGGLNEDDKGVILQQIGETIAQVQSAPVGPLADMRPDWTQFMAGQIAGCRARHIRLGLPERFLPELDELIGAAGAVVPMDAPPVILTGEYIPENFLLRQTASGWRLAGLFDFGDVLAGWGEYDLLGPSAFMVSGNKARLARLLRGFGCAADQIDPAMRRRLMTMMFLHRASDPLRHIQIDGWPHRVATLCELERLVWPIE